MVQVGQIVTYATSGVCRVTARETRRIAGTDMDYYILKPIYNPSMTICVPADNQALVERMRPALDRAQVMALIHAMPQQDLYSDLGPEERRECHIRALKSGDQADLAQMLRSLYDVKRSRQAIGKQLSSYEDSVMREAENMLHSEIALALDIRPDEVAEFIRAELAGEHAVAN